MVTVHFVTGDGACQTIDIPDGWSVMEGAVREGVDGILGDCGGALACATCHVHVDAAWAGALPPPTEAERTMLEMAIDPDAASRLCCQIRIRPVLDGLTLVLPDRQY